MTFFKIYTKDVRWLMMLMMPMANGIDAFSTRYGTSYGTYIPPQSVFLSLLSLIVQFTKTRLSKN